MERKKLALPTTVARSAVIKPRSSPVKEYTDIVLVNKECGILSELLGDCVRRNSGLLAGLRRLKRAVLGPEILIYQYYFIGDERARTTGINYFILRTLPEPAILELTLGLPL